MMIQSDRKRVMTAHRKPRKRASLRLRVHFIAALHKRHDVLQKLAAKRFAVRGTVILKARRARRDCMGVGHHDDHRHDFLRGDERIENPVRLPMHSPGRFVIAVTMREIEHRQRRIARTRRRVNEDAARLAEGLRRIVVLVNHAVRNILPVPRRRRICGDVQDARAGPALWLQCGVLRVDDVHSIHGKTILMHPRRHFGNRHAPHTRVVFRKSRLRSKLPGHFHLRSLRGFKAKRNAAIGQQLRRHKRCRARGRLGLRRIFGVDE